MSRRFHLSLASIMCCLAFLAVSSIAQAAVVENVRSYRAPDYTRLVFDLSERVEHGLFTLEDPSRIVVDLNNAVLQSDFSALDLSNTPISNIRSAVRNGKDTRVVFDLKSRVQARSFLLEKNDQYGNRLVIDFYDGPTTQAKPVIAASANDAINGQSDIVIAISAGHGGDDPGAIGVDRIQEKRVVLALARKIEKILLQTPGYRPVMVRDGDYYVDLRRRTGIAHENDADLFIAIHADAYSSTRARGATIYALSQKGASSEQARLLAAKENSADLIGGVGSVSLNDKDEVLASVLLDLSITASIASSLEVGDRIISSLQQVTRMRKTNVEQAAFVVLKSPDIPSLLIEAGYITNPSDARNLNSSRHQQKFADAVVNGITSYFYVTPPRGSWVSWQKENGAAPGHYTVSRGDSLSIIAERHNISLNALKSANNLSKSTIYIGQELTIPSGLITSIAQVTYYEHTIASGETLSGIANDYSVSLQRIRDSNQLKGDTIRIGQTLRIPSS